jgi:hypothetical protein
MALICENRYNYDGRQTTNVPRVFGVRLKYRSGGKDGAGQFARALNGGGACLKR